MMKLPKADTTKKPRKVIAYKKKLEGSAERSQQQMDNHLFCFVPITPLPLHHLHRENNKMAMSVRMLFL